MDMGKLVAAGLMGLCVGSGAGGPWWALVGARGRWVRRAAGGQPVCFVL